MKKISASTRRKKGKKARPFFLGERGRFYFLSFCCLVFSSPLDDLVGKRIWGRQRDDDDDDACVREKEGGRRAMTVKKKANTTRLAAGRGDPTRDAEGRTAAVTRAFDM